MSRKFTYEYVYKYFKDNGCELLAEEYINNNTKMKYECSCGNMSEITFSSFMSGKRCKKCGIEKRANSQKYSYEHVNKLFEDNGCILLSSVYKNNRTNLDYMCSCGNKSSIKLYNFLQGCRCKKCGGKEPLTFEYVQQYFKDNNCVLMVKKYINAHVKMKYKCSCGNISCINFNHFWQGRRCQKCGIKKRLGKNNCNYNFDITDEERKLKRFYPEYREWRKKVYQRDDYICQCCFQKGGKLNVHHIKNYSNNKRLRIRENNGITMCSICHKEFHRKYGKKNNDIYQLKEFLQKRKICLK